MINLERKIRKKFGTMGIIGLLSLGACQMNNTYSTAGQFNGATQMSLAQAAQRDSEREAQKIASSSKRRADCWEELSKQGYNSQSNLYNNKNPTYNAIDDCEEKERDQDRVRGIVAAGLVDGVKVGAIGYGVTKGLGNGANVIGKAKNLGSGLNNQGIQGVIRP